MKHTIRVIYFFCLFFCSCYASSSMTGPDPGRDSATDAAPDIAADEPDDEDTDQPPGTGIDFIVRNVSGPDNGETYYAQIGFWGHPHGSYRYPFDLYRVTLGEWELVSLYTPFCTVQCADLDDPEYCCMECMPPEFEGIVQMLEPGNMFSLHWDGTLYGWDEDACVCGCYFGYEAPLQEYSVTVCLYSGFECFTARPDSCVPDENGMMVDAMTAGSEFCVSRQFSIPDDWGRTITFDFED